MESFIKTKVNMMSKWKSFCLIVLLIYFTIVLYLAVLGREPSYKLIRLDLFQGYYHLTDNNFKDILVNIFVFVPIGFLVTMLSKNHRIVIALIIGLLLSLIIESSQLIWQRGTFDIDDLFNNTIGTIIGGVIAIIFLNIQNSKLLT